MDQQKMATLDVLSAPDDLDLIELQRMLQKHVQSRADAVGRKIPVTAETAKNLGELADIVKENVTCIQQELAELLDMLPWKYWKQDYGEYGRETRLEDVPELWVEMLFEVVDVDHFLNNIRIAVGMDTQKQRDIYYTKNHENISRQERGY